MMNKIFTVVTSAAICAAMLSVRAYAADITTDTSIYADNAAEIAERANKAIPDDIDVNIKADTVMPMYRASIYDYARTGKFTFTPEMYGDFPAYFADYVDSNGNFAGSVVFVADGPEAGLSIQSMHDDEAFAIDFRAYAAQFGEYMKNLDIDTDITEAKIAVVEGLGYVYYINNGTTEIFATTNFKTNGKKFIVVDDNFKEYADDMLAERNALMASDQQPLTGGGLPAYDPNNGADPGEKNPNTGRGAGAVLVCGIALAACGGVLVTCKKKNK